MSEEIFLSKDYVRKFDLQCNKALEEDVERVMFKLFDEFEMNSGPRFRVFTEVWHQDSFGLIFSGRETFREMYEFTENLFHCVKKYALSTLIGKPNHSLVRYAAIYMLFSLYFKQPCRPMVKIRLVKEELEDLLHTTLVARKDKHWDVQYAWSKLISSHAFHYVASQSQMGLEAALLMEQKELSRLNYEKERANDDYFQSKEFTSMMKKAEKAQAKYVAIKNKLASPQVQADSSLFLTDPNFPETIRKQLGQSECLVQEQIIEEATNTKKTLKSSIGRTRMSIKYKFFGGGENSWDEPDPEAREVENEWTPVVSFNKRRRGGRKKTLKRVKSVKRGRKFVESDYDEEEEELQDSTGP